MALSHLNKTALIVAVSAIITIVAVVAATWIESPDSLSVLSTSATDKPLLTLDLQERKFVVQVAGTVVREYEIIVINGDIPTADSSNRVNQEDQNIEAVYLISAAGTIPSTTLEILSEESNLSVDQIQRYVPHKMIIITDKNLQLYVESNIAGSTVFGSESMRDLFRPISSFVFGRKTIRLVLSPDDAMSLYGVAAAHSILRLHLSGG